MTLSKETAISEMKGRERELVIAIRNMRKRHAKGYPRALVFHEAEEPGADCPLNVCIGQP